MTTILTAAGIGVVVLLAGNTPWAGFGPIPGLAAANKAVGVAVPWAIVPTALYLFAYWRYLGGQWGPSDDAADRRANLRANPLPGRVWAASLGAGVLGFLTLLALLLVVARLIPLPAGQPIVMPAAMPALTGWLLIAMQSVVAGVTEEAAFRGYMQSMVERACGVVVAMLATGTLFGLLHFSSHPADVLLMLPYYVAVSALYGGLTWASNSILPAVVLHSVGDIVVLTRWWLTGRPEWQIGATSPPLVWDRGLDTPFLMSSVAVVLLVPTTAMAYRRLRGLTART
jgi:membrane protease YdiL (CAAX protease family)